MEAIIARQSANVSKARARGNAAGVHFVIAELELGLTFCQLASNAGYQRYARRIEGKARAAHQAALYHVASLVLTDNELRAFIDREARLNLRLRELSDRFGSADLRPQPETNHDNVVVLAADKKTLHQP